jgi:capsular polysaccharide biosynthesis protein
MPRTSPLQSLQLGWKLILGTSILGLFFALAFSLLTPLQYSSSVRLLISQPASTSLDAYTVLKSNERIAQSLSQLLLTSTFFENILVQAEGADRSYFPTDELRRRQLWQNSIETSVEPNSGLMTVTVYHQDRVQAHALVEAAAEELTKQAPNYFGFSVRLQVIDSAIDSRWFTRPNFVANGFFGLSIAFLLGVAWVLAQKPRST